MSIGVSITLLVLVGFLSANVPWMSERFLFVFGNWAVKPAAVRLLEWLLLYGCFQFIGFGMERSLNGTVYEQGWEFYAVSFLIFMVLAIPGVIYRHGFRKYLARVK